jgi:hypothetical protein
MARKKASLDKAVQRAAAILEEHFATLSKADKKKARRELHLLAAAAKMRLPEVRLDLKDLRKIRTGRVAGNKAIRAVLADRDER